MGSGVSERRYDAGRGVEGSCRTRRRAARRHPSSQRALLRERHARDPRRRLRPVGSRAARPRGRVPRSDHRRLAHAARGRFGHLRPGASQRADDVARQCVRLRRAHRLGRPARAAARGGRRRYDQDRSRRRTEDRRAGDLAPLRGGPAVHAATRGDGRVGEDVTPNVEAIAVVPKRLPKGAPSGRRGPGRDLHAPRSVQTDQRGPSRGGAAHVRQPAQHRRRFTPPEGSLDHRQPRARVLELPTGRGRGRPAAHQPPRHAAMARGARFPGEPRDHARARPPRGVHLLPALAGTTP